MIVAVDTSVIISAALKRDSPPALALEAALSPHNQMIISREVRDEYREVLFRPKFDRFAPVARRAQLLDTLVDAALLISVTIDIHECADPKDDKYLALALAGRADVIVSSDDHLLRLNPWRGIGILHPKSYIARAATLPG